MANRIAIDGDPVFARFIFRIGKRAAGPLQTLRITGADDILQGAGGIGVEQGIAEHVGVISQELGHGGLEFIGVFDLPDRAQANNGVAEIVADGMGLIAPQSE